MIIWGYNTTILGAVDLPMKCKSCRNSNISVVHTLRYFTLFWIPIFPYRKDKDFFCESCDVAIEENSFENDVNKHIIEEIGSTFKTPKWTFSGLILIIIMIAFGSYSAEVERREIAAFVKQLIASLVRIWLPKLTTC
jgi:hypothetical protein